MVPRPLGEALALDRRLRDAANRRRCVQPEEIQDRRHHVVMCAYWVRTSHFASMPFGRRRIRPRHHPERVIPAPVSSRGERPGCRRTDRRSQSSGSDDHGGGETPEDPADGPRSPTSCCGSRPEFAPGGHARGHVLVDSVVGTIVDIGPRGFELLSLFSRSIRLGDAIEHLERHSLATDLAPSLHALNVLIEEGVLVTPVRPGRAASGWADPVEHARMLHDERRTRDYLTAIRSSVRPRRRRARHRDGKRRAGDRGGARRCAARLRHRGERHRDVAERVFAANGLQDRITLLPGWSRQAELPEPPTLLVAEVIGNEPLEEEILETTLDARDRLLAPGARLLPHALTLFARPVLLPEAECVSGRSGTRQWSAGARCTTSTSPRCSMPRSPSPTHTITEGEIVSTWPVVGPPGADDHRALDLHRAVGPSVGRSPHRPPGLVNAVAITFRADLAGGSPTPSIRGGRRRRAGRRRSGCCQIRCAWTSGRRSTSISAAGRRGSRRPHLRRRGGSGRLTRRNFVPSG